MSDDGKILEVKEKPLGPFGGDLGHLKIARNLRVGMDPWVVVLFSSTRISSRNLDSLGSHCT